MLQDVTNHIHQRDSRRSVTEGPTSQSTRLMNKYVFGDATVIEEVKKRERKIMKDINHFRNAIAEIDKETVQVRDRSLPDTQYGISKKITICNELKKDSAQLTSQLMIKEGEMDLLRKNEEMACSNLQLKHSIEVQELENQLKQKLDGERLKWEKQILELENLKPDEEVAQEIRQLKTELDQVKTQWNELQLENQKKCYEYEKQLLRELEDFKGEKQEPMDNLLKEQDRLAEKKQELVKKRDEIQTEIAHSIKVSSELEGKIIDVKACIKEAQAINEPLRKELNSIEEQFNLAKRERDMVQRHAHEEEIFYNDKFDKMEQEQLRRRKLENSIDELKGEIRRFAYVIKEDKSNLIRIDYAKKSIESVETGKTFNFSRIIPSSLVSEEELLFQEYEMYHEVCMRSNLSFNLISVSQRPWSPLRVALIKFLYDKCRNSHRINLQYVFLSEEMPSQDMLLENTQNCDIEIKLKIEKESIELDSTNIEINNGLDDLPLNIKEERQTSTSGIGVLKFQLSRLHEDDSECKENSSNFYFIEIYDPTTMSILDRVLTPGDITKSPIGLILRKLLSDTKSCFLFNIDDTEDNEILLDVSHKLGKFKNLRMKRNLD